DDEKTVAVADAGVDRVGQEIALSIEGGLPDVADELAAAGGQIVEDGFIAAAVRVAPAARAGGLAGERAAASTRTSAPTTIRGGRATAQEQMIRRRGEHRRLHVLPALRLARRELAELHPTTRRRRSPTCGATSALRISRR